MQKWEYKVLKLMYSAEKELNELGQQGWELVSVVAEVEGHADRTSSSFYAYLKRPK